MAVASCRRAEDRNGREGRRGGRGEVWRKARREGARSLEAMVEGWSLVGFVACSVVCGDGVKRGWVWLVWTFKYLWSVGKDFGDGEMNV